MTSTVDADGVTATSSDRATIRSRVRERMREQDLAGYVAFTPSNVAYLSGFVSYFLSTWWRMHGTVMVAMATDGDLPPVLIVGDAEGEAARGASVDCDVVDYPMWVETRGYADILRDPGSEVRRPSQWRDEDVSARLAAALLARHAIFHSGGFWHGWRPDNSILPAAIIRPGRSSTASLG